MPVLDTVGTAFMDFFKGIYGFQDYGEPVSVFNQIGGAIRDIGKWLIENVGLWAPFAAGITAAFTAWSTYQKTITLVKVAQEALNKTRRHLANQCYFGRYWLDCRRPDFGV